MEDKANISNAVVVLGAEVERTDSLLLQNLCSQATGHQCFLSLGEPITFQLSAEPRRGHKVLLFRISEGIEGRQVNNSTG